MLIDAGVKIRDISRRTSIPYETIINWRQERRQTVLVNLATSNSPEFHEVTVTKNEGTVAATVAENGCMTPARMATVPVKAVTVPSNESVSGGVTIRTPDGFTIRVASAQEALAIVHSLRGQGGGA